LIDLYLGLPRKGKTTGALSAIGSAPAVIYSPCNEPRPSNLPPQLHNIGEYPYIYDTPQYLSGGLLPYFDKSPNKQFVIRYGGNCYEVMKACCQMKNFTLVLDDMATLFNDADGDRGLKEFMPLMGYNNVTVIGIGHLPGSDVMKKFRVIANRIFWFGPLNDRNEIKILYSMRGIDMDYPTFETTVKNNPIYTSFQIR